MYHGHTCPSTGRHTLTAVTPTRVVRRRPMVDAARRFVATRKVVQTLSVALLAGMPLLGIFRIDIAGGFAVLLWQHIPLPWLALALPAMLLIPLGTFFVLARTYGRLFCSWACPQGYLNEAAIKSHLRLWGRRRPWTTRSERRYPKVA